MANFRKFGEVAGSTTAAQLPDVPFSTAWLKAVNSNAGDVYIGDSGVTLPDGMTDATTGIELSVN